MHLGPFPLERLARRAGSAGTGCGGMCGRRMKTCPWNRWCERVMFHFEGEGWRAELPVPADRSATEVLADAGFTVVTKCSDGLCGTCATAYDAAASDNVEQRDYVLSQPEHNTRVILCCPRAEQPGGRIVLDM